MTNNYNFDWEGAREKARQEAISTAEEGLWKPKPGKNRIRILPNISQLYKTIYPFAIHRNLGEDGDEIAICPKFAKGAKCPICGKAEKLFKLANEGNKNAEALARAIYRKRQYIVNMIDLDAEEPEVKKWIFGQRVFDQLDAHWNEKVYLFDPVKGNDIIVSKVGERLDTVYTVYPSEQKPLKIKGWDKPGVMYNLEERTRPSSEEELRNLLNRTFLPEEHEEHEEKEEQVKEIRKILTQAVEERKHLIKEEAEEEPPKVLKQKPKETPSTQVQIPQTRDLEDELDDDEEEHDEMENSEDEPKVIQTKSLETKAQKVNTKSHRERVIETVKRLRGNF